MDLNSCLIRALIVNQYIDYQQTETFVFIIAIELCEKYNAALITLVIKR